MGLGHTQRQPDLLRQHEAAWQITQEAAELTLLARVGGRQQQVGHSAATASDGDALDLEQLADPGGTQVEQLVHLVAREGSLLSSSPAPRSGRRRRS